ncbi:MAG: maleylpyruvate isomerase family mycothiol-dependent enzyme, partial [Kibdelosporangium sp.]
MSDLRALLDDLLAEGASLDALVAPLAADEWSTPTPAEGWTIAHQIAHLTWTDDASILAATDTEGFQAVVAAALKDPAGFVDAGALEI